jgi:adenine-specific DNA methylase
MDSEPILAPTYKRLIEHGFPCHQVGAETQRERGASSALPPLYYLHVWWARRPLTPSRAAIVASLAPWDADPELFVRQLGIERIQALVNGEPWTLTGDLPARVECDAGGAESLEVGDKVLNALRDEQTRRAENRGLIARIRTTDPSLAKDPVLLRWAEESKSLPEPLPPVGAWLPVRRSMGDPAHIKDRIAFAKSPAVKNILGKDIKWDAENLYGYGRAFATPVQPRPSGLTVLDPTAGGGSIPFEALRLGHNVIANELNPVATTILYATLDYPARFGPDLVTEIRRWGRKLLDHVEAGMEGLAPFSTIPESERTRLREHLKHCPELLPQFDVPEYDHTGLIYCRQVMCPHCGGEVPLLNTLWLANEARDPWGVRVLTANGKVHFETYRIADRREPSWGPQKKNSTVNRGVGTCVHCKQGITGDEVKAQARGESAHGTWTDRLYAVVAVRLQPKLDRHGQPQRYKTGERAGEIKTEKVRFFRPPNARDLAAISEAQRRLQDKWPEWEAEGLIPTEEIPPGHRRDERDGLVNYGITRWTQMFTPRQLLGHLYLIEGLNRLKPAVLRELGTAKGRAVVTYLQFAIDKGLDYNSRWTRWEFTRGIVKGTFGRHDFSIKWTFGEMVFTGPNSGAAWGLSQVLDAYEGIASLAGPLHGITVGGHVPSLKIVNGTGAYIPQIEDQTVDLVCMDPPYYNNVQYGELSDYFYVWQRRTLKDLYPELFSRRLVNKTDEAVANPARDGGKQEAARTYERMMREIFAECRRVMKPHGIMTLMFTHKEQAAWEALTRSLIESGWDITASFPVESESAHSTHLVNVAAAASSIFIACRKRPLESEFPASWTGLGGQGVQHQIRDAVADGLREFEPLRLNPVDEMVASYGRALHVLSQHWPVMDGDEQVSPIRAMNEASRVVAEHQIHRITEGRLKVDDLDPETAMALTLYGIFGLGEVAYNEVLSLSKSMNIRLEGKPGGYHIEPGQRAIGINQEASARRTQGAKAEDRGFAAPLARKGSKVRLALPEERDPRRLDLPQTDWDRLHGLLLAHRRGELPVARQYLATKAADSGERVIDLLAVWAREMADEPTRREAEGLLFGLRQL